jgi:release factor glutamine methyltransferase
MEIRELYIRGKKLLTYAEIESADIEASSLLAGSIGVDMLSIFTEPHKEVNDGLIERYNEFLNRRLNGEPYSYITGTKEFYSLEFNVNNDVLIPRPETELLVETALEKIPEEAEFTILDAGTGSGCIGVTLCTLRDHLTILGTDISLEAVKIAESNSKLNGTGNTCTFINCDYLTVFKTQSADMIVSNPPYIPDDDFDNLQVEVKNYEPKTALLGGKDGLDHLRILTETARDALKMEGWLIFEIGIGQSENVVGILKLNGFSNIEIKKDINGIDRVVSGQWKKY